jgi:hypothetical protein
MKRRHYIGVLCCLMILACSKSSSNYEKKELVGNWLRISSSDTRSDSMTIYIASGDSAIVTYAPPNSGFALKERKWENITLVAEFRDFQFFDLSADGTLWKAFITMESSTVLYVKSAEHPDAPGGTQTWVKF